MVGKICETGGFYAGSERVRVILSSAFVSFTGLLRRYINAVLLLFLLLMENQ